MDLSKDVRIPSDLLLHKEGHTNIQELMCWFDITLKTSHGAAEESHDPWGDCTVCHKHSGFDHRRHGQGSSSHSQH